jgi:hypothetical protein
MYKNIPVTHPNPDAGRFIDTLLGRTSGKVPLVEYLVDETVQRPVLTEMLGREWVPQPAAGSTPVDRQAQRAWLDNFIHFWYKMGYDNADLDCSTPSTLN